MEVANLNYNTLLLEYNNIAHVLFNLFRKSHFYSGFQLVKLIAAFSSTNLSEALAFSTLQIFL